MKVDACLAGLGMTRFGKHLETGLKALGAEAVREALADAGIAPGQLQAAFVGNAAAGLITGQESIRGQVILRGMGLGRLPVVNVENACASGSTALHQACVMVSAGVYDVVLALGVEKLYHPDKKRSFSAFSGAVDVEALAAILAGLQKSAQQGGPPRPPPAPARSARCSWTSTRSPRGPTWPATARRRSSSRRWPRRTRITGA